MTWSTGYVFSNQKVFLEIQDQWFRVKAYSTCGWIDCSYVQKQLFVTAQHPQLRVVSEYCRDFKKPILATFSQQVLLNKKKQYSDFFSVIERHNTVFVVFKG